MKRCGKCKKDKDFKEFRVKRDGYYHSYCRDCCAVFQAKWRKANPGKISKINRKQTLKKYGGMTETEYETLLKSQNGGCAICNKKPENKHLAVDHCHKTGKVRGILCAQCNNAIGVLGDNLEGIMKAASYLGGGS